MVAHQRRVTSAELVCRGVFEPIRIRTCQPYQTLLRTHSARATSKALSRGTTLRIPRDQLTNAFSAPATPVAKVSPGDHFVVETDDRRDFSIPAGSCDEPNRGLHGNAIDPNSLSRANGLRHQPTGLLRSRFGHCSGIHSQYVVPSRANKKWLTRSDQYTD